MQPTVNYNSLYLGSFSLVLIIALNNDMHFLSTSTNESIAIFSSGIYVYQDQKLLQIIFKNRLGNEAIHAWLDSLIIEILLRVGRQAADVGLLAALVTSFW